VIQHPDDGVLHALLDGEIRAAELPAIEAHLRGCTACLTRLEEARAFRDEADRLVGEIELPVPETAVAAASATPAARPRRLQLRPLAYAATLLAALGLGYGIRGWGGSPRSTSAAPAPTSASLEAAPAAPSESSLADMVSRAETLPQRREEDHSPIVNVSPNVPAADTASRVLARRETADSAEERPAAPPADIAREGATSRQRLGFAPGAAVAPAPSLERNRAAPTSPAAGGRRFEGKVTDESGRGLAGASVMVQGTALQARTGEDGGYRLEGDLPDSSRVTARAIGHRSAAKTVAIADSAIARVDFALPVAVNRLEEVVVSGTTAGRAVSALRSPVVLRTAPAAFQSVDFTEAVRRLGGRIRLVDGLIPTRLEALGDTVRVTYRVGRGRDIWLRQFRVGDTVAYTLLGPPDFPADSLASLTSRVTP
jgi:hypothetical protein